MMRKLLYISLFLCFIISVQAQRKEISQAKQWIKHGNNLEKAERSMADLLKDSVNRNNKKIWITLFEAVKKQYEQGNEKLYLKQAYDTTKLFSLGKKMFEVLQSFDSIDAMPNKKGEVKIEYRDEHALFLNQFRPNLFNGGTFFMHKQKFQEAYDMYNAYINCAYVPLFAKYDYLKNDNLLPEASYWAAYSAYRLNEFDKVLSHTPLALKDEEHYVYMLQYLAETYKQKGDTAAYLKTLETGFSSNPEFSFFFPRLVDYYAKDKRFDRALKVIDRALQEDSTNHIYLFAKSTVLLNTGRYDECIEICDRLIARNDSMVEPYLNAGLAYFNQAVILDKEIQVTKRHRQKILDYYHKALPYLEKYRLLAPHMKERWSLPLYTIYLNLNMGKEFDEIDRIINDRNK